MHTRRGIQRPRPLAQVTGTSTNQRVLMAEVMDEVIALATVLAFIIRGVSPGSRLPSNTQAHQHHGRFSHISLEWSLLLVTSPIPSNSTPTERPGSIHWDCNMPRIRGKSRRGAAWYAAQSRRKRKENFERAMAMATRRRRERPRMPPMAVVEEEIPAGGLESPPEHTLFFVPEDWNPRSYFGSAGTSRPAGGNIRCRAAILTLLCGRRTSPRAHQGSRGTQRAGRKSGHQRGARG
jgi:hypothetical protein